MHHEKVGKQDRVEGQVIPDSGGEQERHNVRGPDARKPCAVKCLYAPAVLQPRIDIGQNESGEHEEERHSVIVRERWKRNVKGVRVLRDYQGGGEETQAGQAVELGRGRHCSTADD
jgi:hypothetical protein